MARDILISTAFEKFLDDLPPPLLEEVLGRLDYLSWEPQWESKELFECLSHPGQILELRFEASQQHFSLLAFQPLPQQVYMLAGFTRTSEHISLEPECIESALTGLQSFPSL